MRRPSDPVQVAKAAKALLYARRWSSWSIAGGHLRERLPEAFQVLQEPALRTLLVRPPVGCCRWGAVLCQLAATPGTPEPPRDAQHLELLGRPCPRCARRHLLLDARATARREHAAATMARRLVARDWQALRQWAATPARTGDARVATGMIWTARSGEPPAVTAALTALPPATGTRHAAGTRVPGVPAVRMPPGTWGAAL
jgi:hypothetical protein